MSHKSLPVALSVLLITGCESSGLSVRERPAADYSAFALASFQPAPASTQQPPHPLALPVRLAVAQLGEVAPPEQMLSILRKDSNAFSDVSAVPAVLQLSAVNPYDYRTPIEERNSAMQQQQREQIREFSQNLRQFARTQGADYLLVFGGTIDHATARTPLNVLDLTIVGAYLVPGQRVSAEGRAAASMVDVRSGQVILTLNAQQQNSRLAPTVASENDELKMLRAMRDQLTRDLAEQLKTRVRGAVH